MTWVGSTKSNMVFSIYLREGLMQFFEYEIQNMTSQVLHIWINCMFWIQMMPFVTGLYELFILIEWGKIVI